MARRKIRTFGDPVLRGKCKKIVKLDKSLINLIKDMTDSINEGYQPGVGLAAPQIGISKRVIIINYDDEIRAFINPEIEILEEEVEEDEEGCLSVPGIKEMVNRHKKVKIKAQDIKGNDIEIVAEGFLARVFQHELDHLEGLLFIDRLDKKKKRELISKMHDTG